MITLDEKRQQVSDQCRAVAHLAKALADVSSDYARMLGPHNPGADEIIDLVGSRTAHQMNVLGDILNGMDAVDDGDEWVNPIFEKAKEMYPEKEG